MNFSQQLDLAHAKYAFYDMQLNNKRIAEELQKELKPLSAQNLLIVGSVGIANELINKGYNVTILATSEDMKNYVRKYLPVVNVLVGNIKGLNLNAKFDAIICLGDTFSHFTDEQDVYMILESFYRNLKYGGIILLEKLNALKLFENDGNAISKVENENIKIKRTSSLMKNAEKTPIAIWKVIYELMQNGKRNVYEEQSKVRGFTEKEIEKKLKATNFHLIKFLESGKGNNFVTIARK